jgi:ubiquinone/menaquinone biosynthesis C-methylase UbiE
MNDVAAVPNHHAHFQGFSGLMGIVAALSMITGRKGDARLAVRLSGLQPGETVVDVGCGPGAAVRHAAGLGANVVGVDPAAVMLRVARLLTWRSSRVRFAEGTAEDAPVADGSADVVWSIATAHHWSDVDAALREARRMLAPDGRFVVIEKRTRAGAKGHASHGWTDAQATALAQRCTHQGFADVRVEETLGRGPALAVVALRGS